jgi:hypothetical protein
VTEHELPPDPDLDDLPPEFAELPGPFHLFAPTPAPRVVLPTVIHDRVDS